mgnify:CR=1 FL=1
MGTLERIKEYIDFKGITNQSFEKKVGFSNGAFASQLKNKRTIGVDKLENILIVFNDLSAEWLLTGQGNMLKGQITPVVSEVDRTYKELADARLEVIEGLRFKIASLEQTIITKDEKIAELKYTQEQSFLYPNVAEPAPELTNKKTK